MWSADNIPHELTVLRQWVCWKEVFRNEKPTKIPINPRTGGMAMSNMRGTWGSFGDAMSAYRASLIEVPIKQLKGVGFVFTANDPYVGIDLDDCIITTDNGAEFKQWAKDVLLRVPSYTEVSPSHKGVHIIVKWRGPMVQGSKAYGFEVYNRCRYFTMTGDVVWGRGGIIEFDVNQLRRVRP